MHPLIPIAALGLLGLALSGNSNSSQATAKRRERERRRALLGGFRAAVREVARHRGVAAPPVLAASVPNAASDGRRILVNAAWLSTLLARHCDSDRCSRAVVVGIAAHEMSHHVHRDAQRLTAAQRQGAPAWKLSELSQELELRADYEAGWLLGQLGVAPHDFERVLSDLSSCPDAVCGVGRGNQLVALNTHPPGYERVQAIRQGYWDARGEDPFHWS